MKKRQLGRTGLPVSELCFGAMNFGWTVDRETAFTLLDAYRSAGGGFFQAVHICPGLSFLRETLKAPEEWIGEWLRARSVPRNEIVLSTRLTLFGAGRPERRSLADDIRGCCETSLRRLGVPYLDLLVCQWSRYLLPIDESLRVFDTLIEAGLVRHVGIANVPLWRMMEAIARSAVRNRRRFEALQTEYSVHSQPTAREETQDFCQSQNLGLLVTSALGSGPVHLRRRHDDSIWSVGEGARERVLRKSGAIPRENEPSLEQAALAWVLSHPHVSSVVISTNSFNQLDELVHAASWDRAGEARPATKNCATMPTFEVRPYAGNQSGICESVAT